MLILRLLARIVKVLRAGPSPAQLAWGFTLGMFLGMMPLLNLYSLLIVFLIFFFNVNISGALLGWMFFSLFSYFLDPLFHSIGYTLLAQQDWLRGIWVWMYNRPVIPLSKFNNTVVLGSLVMSILISVPVYYLFKKGIILYRERLEKRIKQLKIVRIIQSNKIFLYYQKIRSIGD